MKKIVIKRSSGLSVDPSCNPTSTLKYWVNPERVLVASFIYWMMVIAYMYAGMFLF